MIVPAPEHAARLNGGACDATADARAQTPRVRTSILYLYQSIEGWTVDPRGRPESGRSGAAVMVTAMGRACYPYTYTMTYPGRRRRLARDRERTGRAGRPRPHPHPRRWVGIVNRDSESVRGVCCVWSDFVGENAPVPSCEEESEEERGCD